MFCLGFGKLKVKSTFVLSIGEFFVLDDVLSVSEFMINFRMGTEAVVIGLRFSKPSIFER